MCLPPGVMTSAMRACAHVHPAVETAAQVAVGKDPDGSAVRVDDRGHAQALGGHLHQRVTQRRAIR